MASNCSWDTDDGGQPTRRTDRGPRTVPSESDVKQVLEELEIRDEHKDVVQSTRVDPDDYSE